MTRSPSLLTCALSSALDYGGPFANLGNKQQCVRGDETNKFMPTWRIPISTDSFFQPTTN